MCPTSSALMGCATQNPEFKTRRLGGDFLAPGPERPGVRESRTARWERLKHTFSCPIPKQGHCAASPERSLPGPQGWLEVLGWAGVDTTAGRWLPGIVQGPHTNFT